MTTISLFIYLFLGGILGGLLSSVASMASLATYPVLLSVGIPPIYANVTNDAALIWTSIGSTFSSLRELHGHWRQVWFYSIFTTLGSVLGSILLLMFKPSIFEKVVPFFVAFSGIMILISGQHHTLANANQPDRKHQFWAIISLIIMGGYTGYFGAAGGVIVLVILTYIMADDFMVINAVKNILCGFANLMALIIYSFSSKVYWIKAIPLSLGMLLGGYIGPFVVRHVSTKLLRWFIAALAFIQAGYFAYTAYWR